MFIEKMAKNENGENWESFEFLSFSGSILGLRATFHVKFIEANFRAISKVFPQILVDFQSISTDVCLVSRVCILGAFSRQVDLQGVFVRIGDFIKFIGFPFSGNSCQSGHFPPVSRGKNCVSQGGAKRGSLISVPLSRF